MTDRRDQGGSGSERVDELVDEAEALIGTEELWRGQILYAGVKLGIFDSLTDGPKPSSELAKELDLNKDRTHRLLRALTYFGVLDRSDQGQFSLTSVGELFTADHPRSVQSDLLFNRNPAWIRSMLHLPATIAEAGPSGFDREFGCGFFEYTVANPEFGEKYNRLMESASSDHPTQVLNVMEGYDFSRFSLICDVGGGRGQLLCHLVKHISDIRGIVFDLPSVVEEKSERWAPKLGVTERVTYRGGDMFDQVPKADAYLLKWILHNWDDDACQTILSTIHAGAPPDGRLFIMESLVPGPETPHHSKRLDITMMTQVGGRERSEREYATLLERSGWMMEETWTLEDGTLSILEAVKL